MEKQQKIVSCDDDFVLLKEGKKILSGGYDIQSVLLKKGISPIKTLNNQNIEEPNSEKVSDLFNHLVIPSGLFYSQQNMNKNNFLSQDNQDFSSSDEDKDEDNDNDDDTSSSSSDDNASSSSSDEDENSQKGGNIKSNCIKIDLYDKLLELASVPIVKKQRKTKKRNTTLVKKRKKQTKKVKSKK
jgi:hypothetical protein